MTKLVAGVVLAAGLLFAQGTPVDDKLYDEVRMKLTQDTTVRGGHLDVSVREAVVTLRGKVRQEKQKIKAERVARKVKGVKNVVNELRVEPY
jgi:hyperosmotically inducible periplasmic protein